MKTRAQTLFGVDGRANALPPSRGRKGWRGSVQRSCRTTSAVSSPPVWGCDDLQFQVCPRTKPEGEQGKDRRHQREHAGDTTAANHKTLSFFLAFGVLSRDNLVALKNLDDNEEGEIARRIERALRDRRQILAPTLAATSWRYVLLLGPGAQIFA